MLRIIFISILTWLVVPHSLAQDTLTIDRAISEAMENNYGIRVARYNAEISANTATAGNAGLLPKLDLNAGSNLSINDTKIKYAGNIPPTELSGAQSTSYNASAGITYVLFDGLANFYTYSKLKAGSSLGETVAKQNIEASLMQIVNAYYTLARAQQTLAVTRTQILLSNKRYERTQLREEFGGTSLEKLSSLVDLNTDSVNFTVAFAAVYTASNNLNQLLGRSAGTPVAVSEVTPVNRSLALQELIIAAEQNNTSLIAAAQNLTLSNLDLRIARAARMPRVSLTSAYGYSEARNDASIVLVSQNTGYSGGLAVGFNLFDGGRKNVAIRNARLGMDINTLRYEEAKNKLGVDVNNAFVAYTNNLQILGLSERSLVAAQLNFNRSNELYNLGQINSIQLREAQLNLSRAETRILEATYNAKVAEMELLRISGKLYSGN